MTPIPQQIQGPHQPDEDDDDDMYVEPNYRPPSAMDQDIPGDGIAGGSPMLSPSPNAPSPEIVRSPSPHPAVPTPAPSASTPPAAHRRREDEDEETSEDEEEEEDPQLGRQRTQDRQVDMDALRAREAAQAIRNQNPFNDVEEEPFELASNIESIQETLGYIDELRNTSFDNSGLPQSIIEQIRQPLEGAPTLSENEQFFIDLYFATFGAPESVYNKVRDAVSRRFSTEEAPFEVPSLYKIRKLVQQLTGIVVVQDDMCVDSCMAFTGKHAAKKECTVCSKPRYLVGARDGKERPRKQMTTILLAPQLQAVRRSPEGASNMRYRQQKVHEFRQHQRETTNNPGATIYDDVFCGSDYLALHDRLSLTEDDIVVGLSLDGAQLYQNVESDTWIGIWIVYDYNPSIRYKRRHVLPAFVIPGPNKPKILDSFTFRSLQHLSAAQREESGRGIKCWDALKEAVIFARIILLLCIADVMALIAMDGRVGHHGAKGCRLGCKMKGRPKPGQGFYYAVHNKPDNYDQPGCDHPDTNVRTITAIPPVSYYEESLKALVESRNPTHYEDVRKETGLCKPSILSGLLQTHMLAIPRCFTVDLMHLFFINLGQLFIPLWQGKLPCEATDSKASWTWARLTGEQWKQHGALVGESHRYFPSMFHRTPRDPAKKINTKYKATEYYLYLYGLGPGFFRTFLPRIYWRNFCRLVAITRLYIQRSITGEQLRYGETMAVQFVEEYEEIYYQRRVDRIHFCRPAIHTIIHVAREAARVGPGAYYTQFTMERAIGYFGQEIRQPSNPFGNLAQITVRASQMSALKVVFPSLDPPPSLPRTSFATNTQGYTLLGPKSRFPEKIEGLEGHAIQLVYGAPVSKYIKWGRLRLPNGQISRSRMREDRQVAREVRVAKNVKMLIDGEVGYGEVLFYFTHTLAQPTGEIGEIVPRDFKALVSFYGRPNIDLYQDSFKTLWACALSGTDIRVVDISCIASVVSMQPLPRVEGDPEGLWFVVEKSGLDDMDTTPEEDNEDTL
ncbi:hypothetical protein D9611_006636 [Ephemerocybe angulata]|uniref:Transposase family Tnp2 protein n=1 Tax=Ephemerocybe angulata TaxID=980116 RepID=A0A8H5FH51_9AGAR|nr:hypothetical protein D9611_006636 [Tulosesus angulatus]